MCYNKTQPERERLMNDFFAYVNRLKYIERWGLMRRTESENLWEHSFQTAVLAHCLALIAKNELGKKADENRVAARALFHDVTEALTGDLPTPVKYYDEDIRQAYKRIEEGARQKLLNSLPDAYARSVTRRFSTSAAARRTKSAVTKKSWSNTPTNCLRTSNAKRSLISATENSKRRFPQSKTSLTLSTATK